MRLIPIPAAELTPGTRVTFDDGEHVLDVTYVGRAPNFEWRHVGVQSPDERYRHLGVLTYSKHAGELVTMVLDDEEVELTTPDNT